jgi:hypothetical protein
MARISDDKNFIDLSTRLYRHMVDPKHHVSDRDFAALRKCLREIIDRVDDCATCKHFVLAYDFCTKRQTYNRTKAKCEEHTIT